MSETVVINGHYTHVLTKLLNKHPVRAFAEGNPMEVVITSMPQSANAVKALLERNGYQFNVQTAGVKPTTRIRFHITRRVKP